MTMFNVKMYDCDDKIIKEEDIINRKRNKDETCTLIIDIIKNTISTLEKHK